MNNEGGNKISHGKLYEVKQSLSWNVNEGSSILSIITSGSVGI